MSPVLNFTMPPAVGSYPMTLGVIADVGQTSNSSTTWTRMAQQNVQAVTLVGDWTYADDYLTNGELLKTAHRLLHSETSAGSCLSCAHL